MEALRGLIHRVARPITRTGEVTYPIIVIRHAENGRNSTLSLVWYNVKAPGSNLDANLQCLGSHVT